MPGPTGRHLRIAVGRRIDFARGDLRDTQIVGRRAQRPAGPVDADLARYGTAEPVRDDPQRSGHRGAEAARVEQARILGRGAQIDDRPADFQYPALHRLAQGPQIDDATAADAAAIDRRTGKARKLEARSLKPAAHGNIANVGA